MNQNTDSSNNAGSRTASQAPSLSIQRNDDPSDGRMKIDIRVLMALIMVSMIVAFAVGVGVPPMTGDKERVHDSKEKASNHDIFSFENDLQVAPPPPVGQVRRAFSDLFWKSKCEPRI